MLKVDGSLDHIPAKRAHVVSLHESINQPLVNIPGYGAAPTGAFILGTRNDRGVFTVFVYLYQPQTRAVLIYVSEPRSLTAEQLGMEEKEAVRFVESMGFMVDDVGFQRLSTEEQRGVIERVRLFRPLGSAARNGDGVAQLGGVVAGRPGSSANGARMPLSGVAMGAPDRGSPPPLDLELEEHPEKTPLAEAAPAFGRGLSLKPRSSPASSADLGHVTAERPASADPVRGRPEAAKPAEPSPERLARLGRLLGTFVLLLGLALGSTACATTQVRSREAEAELDLGREQLRRGHWAPALEHFERVLKMDERDPAAHRGAGLAYWSLGRLAQAEDHLRKAIEIDPSKSDPKNDLAVILIDRGECEEAKGLLVEVLDDVFYPTHHFAEHNLARAEACVGEREAAVARLARITEKRPKFCRAYLTASELAVGGQLWEATVDACEGFREQCARDENIGPKLSPALEATCDLRKGKAYLAIGDVESARTALERCRSVEATRSACRDALAMLPP